MEQTNNSTVQIIDENHDFIIADANGIFYKNNKVEFANIVKEHMTADKLKLENGKVTIGGVEFDRASGTIKLSLKFWLRFLFRKMFA